MLMASASYGELARLFENSSYHLIMNFDAPMPISHINQLLQFLGEIESFEERGITKKKVYEGVANIRAKLIPLGFQTIHPDLDRLINQTNGTHYSIYYYTITQAIYKQINQFAN